MTLLGRTVTLLLAGVSGATANATIPSSGTVHLIINVYGYHE